MVTKQLQPIIDAHSVTEEQSAEYARQLILAQDLRNDVENMLKQSKMFDFPTKKYEHVKKTKSTLNRDIVKPVW